MQFCHQSELTTKCLVIAVKRDASTGTGLALKSTNQICTLCDNSLKFDIQNDIRLRDFLTLGAADSKVKALKGLAEIVAVAAAAAES